MYELTSYLSFAISYVGTRDEAEFKITDTLYQRKGKALFAHVLTAFS